MRPVFTINSLLMGKQHSKEESPRRKGGGNIKCCLCKAALQSFEIENPYLPGKHKKKRGRKKRKKYCSWCKLIKGSGYWDDCRRQAAREWFF
ncbi:E6 [Anas platyrhynchos papillomavirus 2]|nr:E6 [Anas platyrhynchos papillomavirus 2]